MIEPTIKELMERLWDRRSCHNPQGVNRWAQVRGGKVERSGSLMPGVDRENTDRPKEGGSE